MDQPRPLARCIFAASMISLGVLGLRVGDFALQSQPVAAWVPGRTALAYLAAIVMLVGGFALLVQRTALPAARVLLVYLAGWVLLRVPALITMPREEVFWLGFGEILVMFAGGWTLYARLAGGRERQIRVARYLFGAALIPIGLSHFVYLRATMGFIPAWVPYHEYVAYFTGAAHIAAGVGVLLSVVPKLAATMEAIMLTLFSLLVWIPMLMADPGKRAIWTSMLISFAVSAGAWEVAMGTEVPARSVGK